MLNIMTRPESFVGSITSEDQPLLVRGDSLLVLDLGLDILDRVRGLHLKELFQ